MGRWCEWSIRLFLVVWCAGCATTRQSAAEVNAALAWFVPPEQAHGWPIATDNGLRLDRAPAVVIAWTIPSARDTEAPSPATRAAREAWIAAIKSTLDHSGRVARAEGTPPETFDGGVTVAGLRTLAADRHADLIVLFALDVAERRYHVSSPSGLVGAHVTSIIEVRATARTVGVGPSGIPLFSETQTGFASADIQAQTEEELEVTSKRVAVSALADAIVRRVRAISPGTGSR